MCPAVFLGENTEAKLIDTNLAPQFHLQAQSAFCVQVLCIHVCVFCMQSFRQLLVSLSCTVL